MQPVNQVRIGTSCDFTRSEIVLAHGGSALMWSQKLQRVNIMTSCVKTLLFVATAGLCVPAIAVAQENPGVVVGEQRLHSGNVNSMVQVSTVSRCGSCEPSQKDSVSSSGGTATSEPAMAQRSAETRRSFSYEPSTSQSTAAPRRYSAPRMRSSQSGRGPKYLMQKTDSGKY